MDKVIYDFGAGWRKHPGAISIDWGWSPEKEKDKVSTDIQWDLEKKPYPIESDTADFIYIHNLLEHLKTPWPPMEEAFRILKKGGEAEVWIPFIHPIHPSPNDYNRYTRQFLEEMCKTIGFEIVKWKTMGGRLKVAGIALFSEFPKGLLYTRWPTFGKQDEEDWPLWFRFTVRKP